VTTGARLPQTWLVSLPRIVVRSRPVTRGLLGKMVVLPTRQPCNWRRARRAVAPTIHSHCCPV